MARSTLQDSIVDVLRNSLVPAITWGNTASPFYLEAPEPPPSFPFVVFAVDESEVQRQFEETYMEVYPVKISVFGQEGHIAGSLSPYHSNSVFSYLEGLLTTPEEFDGDNFKCVSFDRLNWVLDFEDVRGPAGDRVWRATANYQVIIAPQ